MAFDRLTRRNLLKLGAGSAALSLAGGLLPRLVGAADANLTKVAPKDRKLLFVFCAYGGASIIDSFLPIVDSEVGDPALAQTLDVYPERLIEQPSGSKIRTIKLLDNYAYYAAPKVPLGDLVRHHGADMAVIAHEVSSVNHAVGQQRSLNGAGLDRGRTIMESAALRYGGGLSLPSCNMAYEGYLQHGVDDQVPQQARHELITNPLLFAAGTHGSRGLIDVPGETAIARARKIREKLDKDSVFAKTFAKDERLNRYLRARRESTPILEEARLIDKLLLLDPEKLDPRYGVEADPLAIQMRTSLPKLEEDTMEAQVALGFLMAYHGVSVSVALGYNSDPYVDPKGNITGAPLAFDFSHNMHQQAQSLMWCRTISLVDALITLLKQHDYLGDPSLGKMWDRSLVYIATEFGRDKTRPAGSSQWGTGHHLNNGSLLISPLLKGNAVYGGVDPKTGLTYGFDPKTGAPDKGSVLGEADVYSIIASALDIDVPNARAFPAVVRGA